MVRIRLRRVGSKHQPSYRIVAAEKETARDGRFLEILGEYNPRTEPATLKVREDRLFHWLGHGAQASDSVVQILQPAGAWDRWLRFRKGEAIETLLAESTSSARAINPKTRREGPAAGQSTRKVRDEKAGPETAAESPDA
ncbi:MAG: 30S ribosomal protein S16 [Anaerolineales bacterium]